MSTATAPKNTALVYCYVVREKVGKDQCQLHSGVIPKNEEHCCAHSCNSLWRFCIHCLRQGYKGEDSNVTSHERGVCDFHFNCGIKADRSRIGAKRNEPDTEEIEEIPPQPSAKPTLADGTEIVGELLKIDPKRIRRFKGQPRTYFDPVALKALGRSIAKHGQIHPGIVMKVEGDPLHDYELIDGERRWLACQDIGMFFTAILGSPKDRMAQYEMAVTANYQTPGHTPLEISSQIHILHTEGGRSMAYIAETVYGMSLTWVHNHYGLANLCPAGKELLSPELKEEERLPLTVAFGLAKADRGEQVELLREIREKELDSVAAMHLIRERLKNTGLIVTRERSPNKDYDILRSFLRNVLDRGKLLAERMGPQQFGAMFKSRNLEEISSVYASIEGLLAMLTSLRDRVGVLLKK